MAWIAQLACDRESVDSTGKSVHFAALSSGEPCVFVNVTNRSSKTDIEVTHVGFQTKPATPVLNPDRPLPKRLRPDESWETWLPVTRLPLSELARVPWLGRVRLSTGRTIRTRENRSVPEAGFVPGP